MEQKNIIEICNFCNGWEDLKQAIKETIKKFNNNNCDFETVTYNFIKIVNEEDYENENLDDIEAIEELNDKTFLHNKKTDELYVLKFDWSGIYANPEIYNVKFEEFELYRDGCETIQDEFPIYNKIDDEELSRLI